MKSISFGLMLWAASIDVQAGENDTPAFWLTQTVDACTQLPTMRTVSAIQVKLERFQQEQANTDVRISTSNADVEGLKRWNNKVVSKARYLSLMEALSAGRIADYEYHLEWLVSYVDSGQRVEQLLPLTQVYYLATLYGVSRPTEDSVASEIAEYRNSLSEDFHPAATTTRLVETVEYLIGQESTTPALRDNHWVQVLAAIDASASLRNTGKLKESLSVLDDADHLVDETMEENDCTSPLVGAVHLRLASEYLDTLSAMSKVTTATPVPDSQERQYRLLALVDRTVSELSMLHYPELSSKAHLLLSSIYQERSDKSTGPVSDIYSKMSDRSKMISRDLTNGG